MKLFVAAAATVLVASQAFAGSYQERCVTRSVPYQETVNATPGQVVGGAVVGGVIGKVVTKENAGAAAGAIVGGAIANEKGKKTVTRYKDVETCSNVFVPDRITNEDDLRQTLQDLNNGRSVSKEKTMDVQYTIGVAHDGKWGPKSQQAADEYLANYKSDGPMYSLVVNDVTIVSSADVNSIDQIKSALQQAGVDSKIIVNMQ